MNDIQYKYYLKCSFLRSIYPSLEVKFYSSHFLIFLVNIFFLKEIICSDDI